MKTTNNSIEEWDIKEHILLPINSSVFGNFSKLLNSEGVGLAKT